MPYYSDELIEEVRSRNDIVDVIGSYVHLQKKGSTYFGLCPFHNEKTGSFSVSPNKQMYYCFGCGAGGNVFTFLMQYENFTFPEAMQELADRVGIELPKQEMTSAQRREADRRTQLLEINNRSSQQDLATRSSLSVMICLLQIQRDLQRVSRWDAQTVSLSSSTRSAQYQRH